MLKSKGVSVLISTVMIVLIATLAVALAILLGRPILERAQESATVNEALQNIKVLDNLIREVATEGRGSFRTNQVKVSGGEYKFQEKTNTLEYRINLKSDLFGPGTFVKEGNIILSTGVNAKANNYDLDNDGVVDHVLENEILRIAILRNGSSTSTVGINTSKALKFLNFKDNAVNVTINDSSIILDDFGDSYYGTGYTELVRQGDNLDKGEAVIHVNSTNVLYDVVYTLQSGADFLIVRVQNARFK